MNNPTPPQDEGPDGQLPDSAFAHPDVEKDRADEPVSSSAAPTHLGAKANLHARVDRDFTYHPPKPGQPELYIEYRERARELAHWMVENIPAGRELSRALSDLEDAVMHGNAGIARHG